MRYLNKIIFLNSAHIPYAEVKLDGNVHFIGTQGVGKSTLLRAILFFYNADKLRLGIPKEKKSFDAFYFPYANSYIIYEVMRENGAYCVVAAKSQGRVFFRFIDAPFQQDWFIDEHNVVHSEWGRIREHIGSKIQITAQVTSYEMYRDIIFGNNRKHEMIPYRKFAIVESAKYQNIPRTIQNVFLNSKLDADFIKDTIIRSMSDEDISVDLDFYRSQIKEFEQEYRDVMLWFKNKNGEVPVRKMAEKVMNAYRDLIYTQKQIGEGRAELNFAEKQALHEIPLVKEEQAKAETERERLLRLMGELQQKYTNERDGLIRDIGIISDLLKKIREKRLHYEQMQIEEIIKRVSCEELLIQELEQVRNMKSELTRAYEDVLSKYRLLFEKLEADFRTFENSQQARINARNAEIAGKQEELMQQLRVEEEKVRATQEEKVQTVEISRRPEFLGKIIFLENYDMDLARHLISGVDIWMNTPTRLAEASGTSGEKALMNGVLNFSVLDGWWYEGYRKEAGWAITDKATYQDEQYQNQLDAETIYFLLEHNILPLYYERKEKDYPETWVKYIKNSVAQIAPRFTMKRQLDDYYDGFYNKLSEHFHVLAADNYAKAKTLAGWKAAVDSRWNAVEIVSVNAGKGLDATVEAGKEYEMTVVIDEKGLDNAIGLESVIIRHEENEDRIHEVIPFSLTSKDGNLYTFKAITRMFSAGSFKQAFRMYPNHPLLPHRQDFCYVRWF